MAGVEAVDLHPPDWDRNYGNLDDEEEDEEEVETPLAPILTWSPLGRSNTKGGRLSCKVLLISLGPHASAFVTGHQAAPVVGGILLPEADFLECNTVSDPSCLSSPGGMLSMFQETVILRQPRLIPDDARSFDWVDTVFRHIAPARVVVLCTLAEGAYHGVNHAQPPLLRCLRTSHETKTTSVCPSLELPNLIGGTAAAILSHCEVFGLAASMFVSVESLHAPLVSVAAFEPVLSTVPLKPNPTANYAALLNSCQLRRSALTIKSTLPESIYL
jgi:hypothetical protein